MTSSTSPSEFADPTMPPRHGIYNFSAGPSHMPLPVVDRIREELLDLGETGIGLIEHSHRGHPYMNASADAAEVCRRFAGVGDDYAVFFMPGGATVQFGLLALNFLVGDQVGAYADTSVWARKAIEEAQPMRKIHVAFDGRRGETFRCPDPELAGADLEAPADARYLFYCANNTGEGTWYTQPPQSDLPLIGDLTSDIFSRPWPFDQHAMCLAAGQKNLGAAGCSLIIARRDFLESATRELGPILRFEDHEKANSILNTPPTFAVRVIGLMAEWTEAQGGPAAIATRNELKSSMIWDTVDESGGFYQSRASVSARSHLNVTFETGNASLDSTFLTEAKSAGLENLAGLAGVGGMRASMYNAFPVKGAEILVDFMKDFARRNG